MAVRYDVVVGNIGTVYSGEDEDAARTQYAHYEANSRAGYGRAGGEDVTLLEDGEIVAEHYGRIGDIG